jgi:hypothetical protein
MARKSFVPTVDRPSGFFKIGKMWYIGVWPDSVEKSPYVWFQCYQTFLLEE